MTRASQKSTSAERWAWLLLLLCVAGIPLLGFTSSAAAAVSHTASATNSVNSNSITVSRPAGTATGDVLVAQIVVGSNKNLSAPAGWTLIYDDRNGNQVEQWTYWRIAAGGDPGSWTFSWTGNDRASGAISAYAGADTASPIGNTSTNTGNSTNATATSINAGIGSAVVVLPALGRASSFTPPAGASERYDETTGGGANGVTIAGSDFVVTAAGPTGDQTSVAANSRRWVAHMLEIQADPELTASFPADYSWGDLAIGSTDSSEQITQVSSNRSWGLKVSSDIASGKMTEFDGSSYLPNALGSAMDWRLSSVAGSPQATSFAPISSSPATVISGEPAAVGTVDVGVTYRQSVDYGDTADIGSNVYRILVTYDAAQGF